MLLALLIVGQWFSVLEDNIFLFKFFLEISIISHEKVKK